MPSFLNMKKAVILLSTIIGNIVLFSFITKLLRQPDDSAVAAGVALMCIFVLGNIFIIMQVTKMK
jgi:hypothetical protein